MNKRMAVMSMVLIAMSIAAAAIASTIQYDYDREVDFSKWKLAVWRSLEKRAETMVDKRIVKAIEAGFAGRGYAMSDDRDQADFVIDYRLAAWQDVSLEGNFRRVGIGGGYARVNREVMGALIIDVYDRKTGKLAWHGMVSDALDDDPDGADKRTAKAVEKLLKKFPAKGGGK